MYGQACFIFLLEMEKDATLRKKALSQLMKFIVWSICGCMKHSLEEQKMDVQ